MPEILTESFCERCGTRYTFESAAPTRAKKLGRFKTISKGLKNYVLSDDSSMDEAMAAARSDQEREVTSHQLDAFHATFNFCMSCRQYTCGNCWNQAEGRCLTCAPHLGHEIMPAPFPDLGPVPVEPIHVDASAWPMTDLAPDSPDVLAPPPDLDEILAGRLARLSEPAIPEAVEPTLEPEVQAEAESAGAWPIATEPGLEAELAEDEQVAEPAAETQELSIEAAADEVVGAVAADEVVADEIPAEVAAEVVSVAVPEAVETVEVAVAEPVAEELPTGVDERAAAAARRTAALLSRFRPGQNIDAELAAYEAAVTAEPAAEAPEPAVEAAMPEEAAEPVPAAAEPVWVEPEVVAAAAEPEAAPEPVVAETAPEPVMAEAAPEPEPELVTAAEPVPELEPVAALEAAPPAEEPVAVEAAAAFEEAPEEIAAEAPEEVAVEALEEVAVEAPEEVAAESLEEIAAAAAVEPEPEYTAPAPEPVRADRVEQPTWRIVASEAPAVTTNGHGHAEEGLPAVASSSPLPPTPAEPQWPVNPEWPSAQPNASLLANRRTSSSAANDALWAASARDVVTPPPGTTGGGVQSCTSCGLSLSATARFCRRCGSRQGA